MITLEKLREERNLTQEELSIILDESIEKIKMWEGDCYTMYANELLRLCLLYDVSPDEILVNYDRKDV